MLPERQAFVLPPRVRAAPGPRGEAAGPPALMGVGGGDFTRSAWRSGAGLAVLQKCLCVLLQTEKGALGFLQSPVDHPSPSTRLSLPHYILSPDTEAT